MHDSLPVFVTLNRSGVYTSTRCLLCDAEEESITHLFLQCTFARAVWHGSMLEIRTTDLNHSSTNQWLLSYVDTDIITGCTKMELLQAVFTILWTI